MNRKTSTTPKKAKKSSAASRKKLSSVSKSPKSTPPSTSKSLRTRILPKSPISESMKQSKINEFFKPISPSLQFSQTDTSSSPEPEIIDITPKKLTQRQTSKGPKVLAPIFGSQKRYCLRKSNETNSAKKLRFETNESQNESSDNHNSCAHQMVDSVMDVSEDCEPKEPQKEVKVDRRRKVKKVDKSEQNLNQMMDSLDITVKQKKSTKTTNILNSNLENIRTIDGSKANSSESGGNRLSDKNDYNSDDDLDLRPVFKIPEVPKERKTSKENSNKYVDKEKEKRKNYFLKNLLRIKRDKEMLSIQSIEDMQIEVLKDKAKSVKCEENVVKEVFQIKSFEGIDIFGDFIPKTLENYLSKETDENCGQELSKFSELSLNKLIPLLPLLRKRLKECERQLFIGYILHRISTEDNSFICSQSEYKLIQILSEFEICLSLLLQDFYRILNRISKNIRKWSEFDANESAVNNELNILSNVMRVLSHVLRKSSFAIEFNSVEELINLLIISFALCLDYRVIKNGDQIIEIKNFIGVVFNNICVDETKAVPIVERLLSFCICEERDVMIVLHIASLFPLDIDFDLKRKFCVSVIKSFVTKNCEIVMNLNQIQTILEEIQWKTLLAEDFYVIIQMIGLSLDLPKDLIEHKQTITTILGIIDNKINNSSVVKASDFEFSEIHKSLIILRTKVNVSTKRF